MSSSWYQRKMGAAPGAAPQVPQGYPQQSYPGGPAAPPYVPPISHGQAPQVTKDNIAEVAGLWKGGQGTKTETSSCPNCGGDHYFSVSNAPGSKVATQHGMASAAGRCFTCGWTPHHGLQTGAMG